MAGRAAERQVRWAADVARSKKPKYTADKDPDARFWSALSEDEQVAAIMQHHRVRGVRIPDPKQHALVHLLAEQQIFSREVPAANSALGRLTQSGLPRHEAIHAVGWILSEYIFLVSAGAEYEHSEYVAALDELTVESWYDMLEEEFSELPE